MHGKELFIEMIKKTRRKIKNLKITHKNIGMKIIIGKMRMRMRMKIVVKKTMMMNKLNK